MMDSATDEVYQLQIAYGVENEDKVVHLCERWAKVIDNVRYLIFEHRHKEKEYGVKWRLAYNDQLETEIKLLRSKFDMEAHDSDDDDASSLNILLSKLIHKDWKDVQTFAANGKFDLMLMLNENLQTFEMSVGYLRSILKIDQLPELIATNANLRSDFE